jgi:RHS repeat-associated protein
VTVNSLATARKGDYFYKELTVDNSSAASYPQISVVGARNNFGAGGEDAVTEKGGRAFVPPAVESFTYDFDGNLINDGRWIYSWNAENRLIGMEAAAGVPVEAKKKLEFNYDFMGRRILKKVSVWNAGTSQYDLQSETKFVYDGWTPVAELAGNNTLIRSYVWGSDLSEGLEDAGSVGGLLLVDEGGNRYQAGYDGNGNVTTLVNAATGAIASSYEYDPFGNTLKASGDYANTNPFRFSTKYTDQESGLVYYGYRFYNPQTGKWLNKDPLEEAGGINLYAFNTNDSVNDIDYLGLRKKHKRSKKGTGHHIIPWSLFNGKVNNAVYEFFNSEFARIWHDVYNEHNANALNNISHKEYTGLVKQELKKFLGNKKVRQMTIEEAETFLHKIKNMPHSSKIRQFNDGVLDEAAESIARKLGRGTRHAAKSSLMRALKIGARRVPRGLSLLSTVVSFAFIAEDVMANGVEKAIDNEVRETGRQADSFVQSVVRVWERGTIQHYGKKLVELCDISKWWD